MAKSHSGNPSSHGPDIRSEFKTKDGIYKNLTSHQFCKPRGQPLLGRELSETRVSVVSVKDIQGLYEWIVFNSGRELFCYPFQGTHQPTNLSSPVDKHAYRSSYPLSHDINVCTRSVDQLDLIVGFNGGPLQHINPLTKSCLGSFNADRSIDPSDVTCVRWVPGSETQFVASHRTGRLYVWSTEYLYKSSNTPSTFHVSKQLKDTTIHVCKPKKESTLLFRWDIGHGSIQQFEFSPDTVHMATASQDGFLRVYNFKTQELYGRMRSYYGGFLCVCWSPDGKYVVAGGEDDLISVWSFEEKVVLARGQGHKSYVNKVAFDPHTSEMDTIDSNHPSLPDLSSSSAAELKSQRSSRFFPEESRSYRLGSVGQDGLLCMWELSGDSLCMVKRLHGRSRSRTTFKQANIAQVDEEKDEDNVDTIPQTKSMSITTRDSVLTASIGSDISKKSDDKGNSKSKKKQKKKKKGKDINKETIEGVELESPVQQSKTTLPGETDNEGSITIATNKKNKSNSEKSHKKFSVKKTVSKFMAGPTISRRAISQFESSQSDDIAPSMQDVNIIEPLVCKKIWNERLTDIMFRDDCLLVATQDGYVQVWGRPEFINDVIPVPSNPGLNSPKPGIAADNKHTSV